MHHPTGRRAHPMTFGTPVVEHRLGKKIAQSIHHEGSIQEPNHTINRHSTTELHLASEKDRMFEIKYIYHFRYYKYKQYIYTCTSIIHVIYLMYIISYFLFQPVLHDWCNKGRGMSYPVCGMMNIKEPLLLIAKNSPCGGSGFSSLAI